MARRLPIPSSAARVLAAACAAAFAAAGCADYWFGTGPGAVASVTTPSGILSGDIAFAYTLSGKDGTADIAVSYSTDGTTFRRATEGPGSDGTRGLAVLKAGVSHTFVWSSGVDLPGARHESVVLRIAPEDGDSGSTSPFRLHNGRYLGAVESVAAGASSKVRLYSADVSSGRVSFVQSLASGGTGAYDILYDRGIFYVANETSDSISALQLLEDARALMPVAGSPFAAGISGPRYLATDGTRLFVSGTGNSIAALDRDQTTGALAYRSSAAVEGPRGLLVRSGYLYVASETTGNIFVFDVDSGGTLYANPSSPISAGGTVAPRSLLLAGLRIYAASASSPEIAGFNILAGGGLAPLGASPFPLSVAAPEKLVLNGSRLFAVSGAGERLVAATIDPFGSVAEDAASPVALGGPSYGLATADAIVVAATTASEELAVWTLVGTSSLAPAAGSPFAAGAEIARIALSD
ncbi:MAG: beta-propeller fold lactonase family protein [Planctomycetota bacterium]